MAPVGAFGDGNYASRMSKTSPPAASGSKVVADVLSIGDLAESADESILLSRVDGALKAALRRALLEAFTPAGHAAIGRYLANTSVDGSTLGSAAGSAVAPGGKVAQDGLITRAAPSGAHAADDALTNPNVILNNDDAPAASGSSSSAPSDPAARPRLCRSRWKGIQCTDNPCTLAHPDFCGNSACAVKRTPGCNLWHPRSKRRAQGNGEGGRRPLPKTGNNGSKANKKRHQALGQAHAQPAAELMILRTKLKLAKEETRLARAGFTYREALLSQRPTLMAAQAPLPSQTPLPSQAPLPAGMLLGLQPELPPLSQQQSPPVVLESPAPTASVLDRPDLVSLIDALVSRALDNRAKSA